MHGSTSSATSSIDRYSSGMEGRVQRKKTLDKSNSKKRWSFRPSKRSPQSPSLSLPDDRSSTTRHPSPVKVEDASPVQKPMLKITRSGSMRSLKIVRSKSRSSSESKGLTAEGLRSNRATFSSTLKDSKFPEQVDPQVGEKESEEILPVAKLCLYQHCSLHGHHHHHEPPVKRFSFLKRRSSKDQKGINPKAPATIDKPSGKKTDVKVAKKGSNVGSDDKKIEKAIGKDVDFSIEFYAKTRSEHVLESSSGLDDADLADIMFGVNGNNQNEVQTPQMDDRGSSIVNIDKNNENPDGFDDAKAKKQGVEAFDQERNSKIESAMKSEKEKYIKMWHMIYQHVVTDITSKVGSKLLRDGDNEQEVKDENINNQFSPIDADMLIRQSVNEILLPEAQEDVSTDNQLLPERKEVDGGESQKQLIPKNWNKLRKLRRSIKDLESSRKPKPETPRESVFQKEQEGEQVDLRRQMSREKTKAEQWMIDYAVQHIVTKLTPARKKRVSMLVEAFEAVIPLPET